MPTMHLPQQHDYSILTRRDYQRQELSVHIAQRPRRRREELVTREPILPRRRHNVQPLQIRRFPLCAVWIHPVRATYIYISIPFHSLSTTRTRRYVGYKSGSTYLHTYSSCP